MLTCCGFSVKSNVYIAGADGETLAGAIQRADRRAFSEKCTRKDIFRRCSHRRMTDCPDALNPKGAVGRSRFQMPLTCYLARTTLLSWGNLREVLCVDVLSVLRQTVWRLRETSGKSDACVDAGARASDDGENMTIGEEA